MSKLKKVQIELAIQRRVKELQIDHRGFSKRQLYAKAKRYVMASFNGYVGAK